MARVTLPVTDITRLLVAAPAMYAATGSDGFKFENGSGDVFLEVISSTTAQQFTVLTGLVIDNEWAVADTLATVTQAAQTYMIGPFPQNIYNQDTVDNEVYVDHAVGAVLSFRAWRI
jgi:hypothetical protein